MYEMEYPVLWGKKTVGKVSVEKEGLYYHFCGRCRIDGNTILRLYASCGEKQECLGVMLPGENGFQVETKLPVKRLGDGPFAFHLAAKHDAQRDGTFVPVYPDEPFRYIAQLKEGFLSIQNGKMGIVISAKSTSES